VTVTGGTLTRSTLVDRARQALPHSRFGLRSYRCICESLPI
jgi:hypothetical protein